VREKPLKKEENINIQYLQQQSALKSQEDIKVPDTLIKDNLTMVQTIVGTISSKKQIPAGIDKDDLISWGVEGLIKAYRNFNSSKGSKFSTYAYYRIRGEIFDRLRDEWHYRNPASFYEQRKQFQDKIVDLLEQSFESGNVLTPDMIEEQVQKIIADTCMSHLISLDAVQDLDQFQAPDETASTNQQILEDSVLWEEIQHLEPEEKDVVTLFYLEGVKQKEIAKKLNYSNSKICRIHLKALEKLRKKLKSRIEEEVE
jgi:RNA polymerase sigma factor for flagellar operon FliA